MQVSRRHLGEVVRTGLVWLSRAGADELAVARRAFVVKIEAPVFEATAAGPDMSVESAHFNEGLKNKFRAL